MPEQPVLESTGGEVPIRAIFEYLKKFKGIYKLRLTGKDLEFSIVFYDGKPIIAGGSAGGLEYHGVTALTTATKHPYEKLIVSKIEDNRNIFPRGSLTELIPPLKAGYLNVDVILKDIQTRELSLILSSENWGKIVCIKKEGLAFVGVKPPKSQENKYPRQMISNVEELLIPIQPVSRRKVFGVFEPSELINIFQASDLLSKQIIVQENLTISQP